MPREASGQWTHPARTRAGQLEGGGGICVMVGNGGQDLITPGNDIPGVIVCCVSKLCRGHAVTPQAIEPQRDG